MTSRVERFGDATLYLGNCRDSIQQIGLAQERCPGLAVISDPPYGMDYDTDSRRFSGFKQEGLSPRGSGRADRTIEGDAAPFDPSPWLTFDEVILWGANHTGVAALRLGRKFTGIEMEERWFDVACRRIEAEANQPRMAIEPAPRPTVLKPML